MVQHGHDLLGRALELATGTRGRIDRIAGLHVLDDELLHEQASHDLDLLHVLIDLDELGISGYQAADWLRAERQLDCGLSDHRRIEATLSFADDLSTVDRLVSALEDLVTAAREFRIRRRASCRPSAILN